jgi:hypothetical protein
MRGATGQGIVVCPNVSGPYCYPIGQVVTNNDNEMPCALWQCALPLFETWADVYCVRHVGRGMQA